jgi:hypothetical protein
MQFLEFLDLVLEMRGSKVILAGIHMFGEGAEVPLDDFLVFFELIPKLELLDLVILQLFV